MSAFLAMSALALASAGSAAAQCQSILDAVEANGLDRLGEAITAVQDLEGAEALVEAVTATEEFADEDKITVFAPNNGAWPPAADLPTGADLLNILAGHVISQDLPSTVVLEALSDATEAALPSLAGSDVTATKEGEDVFVAAEGQDPPAKVVAFDVETCAGVVHVIDTVLIPGEGAMAPDSDDAMAPDSMAPQAGPCTSLADAITENGLGRLGEAVTAVLDTPNAAALKTLATATEELAEEEKITVFAPADAAWPAAASLPTGDDLLGVLLGHVVPDYLPSTAVIAAVSDMEIVTLTTLQSTDLNATTDGTDVFVAAKGMELPGAKVIALDVETCVGVVHVVDKVLLPADMAEDMQTETGEVNEEAEENEEGTPDVPPSPGAAPSGVVLGVGTSVLAGLALLM